MELNIKEKFKIAAIKRKATIARKKELKEINKLIRINKRNMKEVEKVLRQEKKQIIKDKKFLTSSKKLINAGYSYSNEKEKVNEKFKLKDVVSLERAKRKYEKNLDINKTAINNMFQIRILNDVYSLNMVVKQNNQIIIKPNESFIKNRVLNILDNEVKNNSKNLKMSYFMTIKYLISSTINDIDDEYINNLQLGTYDKKDFKQVYFNSEITSLTSIKRNELIINDVLNKFQEHLEEMNHQGSGGMFAGILKVEVKMSKSKNIFGGSYVELPDKIKNKRACVNIKNSDEKCFLWSLVAFKKYDEIKGNSKNEVRHYKKYEELIIKPEYYSFPVETQAVFMWEEANNIKINVFVLDEEHKLKIEYHSNFKTKEVCNLLLFNGHYVWLKSLDMFDASNTSDHSIYRCSLCLSARFPSKELLEKHIQKCICEKSLSPNEVLPNAGKNIKKFENIQNEFMHPFHAVADFESTLEEVKDNEDENTQKYQQHVANSYGLKYSCIHDEYSEPIEIYNNSEPKPVIKNFVCSVERLARSSYKLMKQNINKIIITDEEKITHNNCLKCSRCETEFTEENKKVKHHDHITGKFISTFCNNCNLKYQYKLFLPVYIHNLKGYDAHLFISGLFEYGEQYNNNLDEDNLDKNGFMKKGASSDRISCIPNNEERYISFSKKIVVDKYKTYNEATGKEITKEVLFEIRFIDSFAFMASSLDSLSNNLKTGCETIEEMRKIFTNTSKHFKNDVEFKLMTQKGIYPYDYINNYSKLNERRLPNIKDFYSKLNNKECSQDDYNNAVSVWRTFNCKTMLDYHNIYLISDVLLLSDIWANFRALNYKIYGLDSSYYYTAPGLSWDAQLKYTEIELELITDKEKYLFIECGIRGGISQISTRHAEANNKYMSTYDEKKDESSIIYLDANNLYGHAMSSYLPVKNFEWNNDEWTTEKIMKLDDKGEKGYLFAVDLHLPDNKHDYFNNYPLCPENISIKKNELNKWQQKNYCESKINKLCLTFHDKINYVVNYRYLKLALSLGYELLNVRKVLEYSQSNFLEKYILKNTELRTKAVNDFEKDFYKLMNNSVYGKTMENVRNRINFRLISTEEEALRVKNLKRFNIFNDNLVGLHIVKKEIKLDKPIYLGQNILDESKILMSAFHFNFMLKHIERENIDLLFTDTDSLCYHIRKQDIFKIIGDNNEYFDLSNYPKNHELYNGTNNKVIGKFKNESVKQIKEFVGLRSKLYSFITDGDDHKHNKCKGVKKYVVESELTLDDYKNTLYTRKSKKVIQNGIRSYNHEIFSETQNKVALSACDDKVFICDNNINTYNFGHYKIRNELDI